MSGKKLHILFLTGWYPSRVLPINGDFVKRHAQAIAGKHKVSVVHVITDSNATKKIEIHISKNGNLTNYIAYVKGTYNPITKLIRFYSAFKNILIKTGNYDLIHLNKLYSSGIVALFLKIINKTPYLITEHWSGYQKPHNLQIGFIEKTLSKIIVKKASFVCPVSKHLGEAMVDFGLEGNYYPVPNVVMTDIFYPINHKNKTLNLIHISSLYDEVKNIRGILKALGQLKNKNIAFQCIFVGGIGTEFTSDLQKNNLNTKEIRFIDFIEQPEMVQYLQKADSLLLFSNYENLPCVILEAFSCGVPAITTNVGGISEYFPKDFGTLIPVKDTMALTKAIEQIKTKKRATPKRMHQYAVDHFSTDIIAEKFNSLYLKMLS